MDGVVILNEYAIVENMFFVIPLAVGIVLSVISMVSFMEDNIFPGYISGFCAGCFFAVCVLTFLGAKETRYEALVDTSVSAVELMDTYEFIDRKGDIWVLKLLPKGDDENGEI